MSSKEAFKQEVGRLTDNCAYVKSNGDEVEYIRIDTNVFDAPDTMAKDIVEFSEKMKQAGDIVMKCETIDDLGKYIDPFVIQYHPSWIFAREAAGLVPFNEGEELCSHMALVKTYDRWYHDYFIAAGVEPLEKPNINPDIPMSLSVFESLFDSEEKPLETKSHKDHTAFQHAIAYINSIDDYTKKTKEGKRTKGNFKGASYKLSKEGFPIIVIDYKDYDFRRDKQEENCFTKIYKKTFRPNTRLIRARNF